MAAPAVFRCFLVKIASRCNIDCDYCYVYHHVDQTWRDQPRVMSITTKKALAGRIAEYVNEVGVPAILVVFHGGEPLLAGSSELCEAASLIRSAVGESARVDFSLQTNGTLLTRDTLDELWDERIGVSLSLDGPRSVNDAHRLARNGKSTFDQTMRGLALLQERQEQFAGVISVIDPLSIPSEVLSFFAEIKPPSLDLLLPDANHLQPPIHRAASPDVYLDWLLTAFDVWFDHHPTLRIRFFDNILRGIAGLPSNTDGFGLGDVTMLTVETDGSYHDLDVLKITTDGATALQGGVHDTPISAMSLHPQVQTHQTLISSEGLCRACQDCAEASICGGGSLPHRFGPDGFDHPTVYCAEMLGLLAHARRRVVSELRRDAVRPEPGCDVATDIRAFDAAEDSGEIVHELHDEWSRACVADLRAAVQLAGGNLLKGDSSDSLARFATSPSVVLWTRLLLEKGPPPLAVALPSTSPLDSLPAGDPPHIHRLDPWLRLPFTDPIRFEDDPPLVAAGHRATRAALELVAGYSDALAAELRLLSPEIQFIRDVSAHPDKLVSFSDDSVPGALYVGIVTSTGVIAVEDLADSLIHEHRHQKLYLLDRSIPLVRGDWPPVVSPWRDDLRPPSGLFHAVFVFAELLQFWRFLLDNGDASQRAKAESQTKIILSRLIEGFDTLDEADLTSQGRLLLEHLRSRVVGAVVG